MKARGMKATDVKVGNRFEFDKTGRVFAVTEIGGDHGDEIAFDECVLRAGGVEIRKRLMTFRQWEQLRCFRKVEMP